MKKPIVYGTLAIATAALLFSGSSWARGHRGPPDTNGDGVISLEEVTAHVEEKFKSKDTNGDGCISLEEMKAKATERFNRMDQNQDGQITQDEKPRRGQGRRGGPPSESSQE